MASVVFIKPRLKGRNFIWDLHAVVGTWVVIFYLILACTGLFWSYEWWRNGMFKVLGVEREQPALQGGNQPRGQEKNCKRLPVEAVDSRQVTVKLIVSVVRAFLPNRFNWH